jgi:choice-of-anchor B domain-containing protein
MRRHLRRHLAASVALVLAGMSATAYATTPQLFGGFSLTDLRADAHKSRAAVTDTAGIPVSAVSDAPCVDGLAAGTFPCSGVDLLSFTPSEDFGGSAPVVDVLGGGVSDLWGWVDPDNGDEYVMLGKTNGVALFRVTDPTAPVFLGQIDNPSPGQFVWHDIKVYDNHAFIVSESVAHGMNVFDLTRLRGVSEPQEWKADTNYPTAFSAHNIAINEETGFAYLVGGNNGLVTPDQCLSGLHMVDIRNPKLPVFAGCHAMGEGRGTVALGVLPASPVSYIHDTQCVVYRGPDADHTGKELCFNSSEDHVSVVDVSNKLLPRQIAKVEYPETAYAHQGWLTDDMSHFMMGDELDEGDGRPTRTLIFDMTDLDAARFVGAHEHGTPAIDHNMYVKDGLVYQSNYAAGLRVLDTAPVAEGRLQEVAFFDSFPANDDPEFVGTWSNYPYFPSGTVAVSGIDEGLFLVRVQDSVLGTDAPAQPGKDKGPKDKAPKDKAPKDKAPKDKAPEDEGGRG